MRGAVRDDAHLSEQTGDYYTCAIVEGRKRKMFIGLHQGSTQGNRPACTTKGFGGSKGPVDKKKEETSQVQRPLGEKLVHLAEASPNPRGLACAEKLLFECAFGGGEPSGQQPTRARGGPAGISSRSRADASTRAIATKVRGGEGRRIVRGGEFTVSLLGKPRARRRERKFLGPPEQR